MKYYLILGLLLSFQILKAQPTFQPQPFFPYMKMWQYPVLTFSYGQDSMIIEETIGPNLPPWDLESKPWAYVHLGRLKDGRKVRMLDYSGKAYSTLSGFQKIALLPQPKRNFKTGLEEVPTKADTSILITFFGKIVEKPVKYTTPVITKVDEPPMITIDNESVGTKVAEVKGMEIETVQKKQGKILPVKAIHQKWQFFNTPKDIEMVTLEAYKPANQDCKQNYFTAAVLIVVRENGEKIRVIDFCNTKSDYETGKKYKMMRMFFPNADFYLPNDPNPETEQSILKTFYAKILY